MTTIKVAFATVLVAAAAAERTVFENDNNFQPCETKSMCNLWKEKSTVDATIDLTIVMKRSAAALATLEERFWAVSDPTHVDYGNHLTQKEIKRIVAPDAFATKKVVDYFSGKDTTVEVGNAGDLIHVQISSHRASEILATKISEFEHSQLDLPSIHRATESYSLPQEIGQHVKMISGLRHFPTPKRNLLDDQSETETSWATQATDSSWPMDCGKCSKPGLFGALRVTPEVLTQRYNLGQRTNATAKGSIAVAEFTNVYYDQDDLNIFGNDCGIGNITVDKYVGPINKPKQCKVSAIIRPNFCKEALLDIQTIKGIGGTIPLTNFYNTNYDLLAWAKQIGDLSDAEMPLVHSVSYGNDEKQQTSTAFMESVNVELQKLGARGATIIFASGDAGVIGRDGSQKRFAASFPSGSPYVTSVGGTDFSKGGVVGEETAWWGSGGGFSDTFGIPSYQTDVVAAYKKNAAAAGTLPAATKWNNTGRGFPDVSALGGRVNQYCIAIDGKESAAYGTSAATPVIATVVAKLNEARLNAGGKPLGFINPLIFKHPECFNDVVTGNNGGRNGLKSGFTAMKGWDPLTGLGTPNFEALKSVVLKTMN